MITREDIVAIDTEMRESGSRTPAAWKMAELGTLRRDLAAFLLLDKLLPSDDFIIRAAWHDMVCLGVNIDALCKVATPYDILVLFQCGVQYDEDNDWLYMDA